MATKEELDHALRMFKKRLKLYQRDDESSMGGGPMSGGKQSSIVGVKPPSDIPQATWDELVALGKLVRDEGGLYRLAPPRP
ncbi:MAG: hypothetical protein L0216_16955 [Planctomycetales bacterium]|nr:hypothetical protein [Planctomycetales bacterium]